MFRFTIRDVLLVMVVVAILSGYAASQWRLAAKLVEVMPYLKP